MSHYETLSALPLEVEAYDLELHTLDVSSGFERLTNEIVLRGGSHEGRGEDVIYEADLQSEWQDAPRALPLAFSGTLGGFYELLGTLDPFSTAPENEVYRNYRRWGLESAALDLALRQAGTSFDQALGAKYEPVRFVLSLRLGDPPSMEWVNGWLELQPSLQFKLDAEAVWPAEIFDRLAATGAVESVDLKGLYHGSLVDQPPNPALYRRVVESFPQAWIEDPAINDQTRAILEPAFDRITWDAPIHSVADIEALEFQPKALNIKPSRFGSLQELMAAIEYCDRNAIAMYSGGQFELGVGREQLHALASVFFADSPNDAAPVEFHTGVPALTAPISPLTPPSDPVGFRWHSDH